MLREEREALRKKEEKEKGGSSAWHTTLQSSIDKMIEQRWVENTFLSKVSCPSTIRLSEVFG